MSRAGILGGMLVALSAGAAPRTVLVAAGDCRDAALLTGLRELHLAAAKVPGAELLEGEVVLDLVRPRAGRSLQDIERQVESAKALLYGGQDARGLEVIDRALADLERVSPTAGPWPTTRAALVLQVLMFKNLERPKEMNEALRRILRIEPSFRLDPDAHPPSALAALEAQRRELQRAKKSALSVRVESGPPAAVFVDGAPLGVTPLELALPAGGYRVALVAGDAVSFPRRVELPRDAALGVDLAFEGAVAVQPPLCLHGVNDGAALRLAQLATAEWVIVLRNLGTRGNPPDLAGALYAVATGRQERAGAVQPERLESLATFLVTGREQRGVEPAGTPTPTPAPVAEAPLAPVGEVVPSVSPTFDAQRGAPVGKIASGVLLGAGVLTGVAGALLYASAAPGRARLAGLTDANGQLPAAGTSAHREALQLMGTLDTTRAVSFSLVGVAAGAVVGGALGLWLFPAGDVAVTVAPTPGGAAVSFSGAL